VAESDLITTDSGLKYADLITGEGETAKAGDIVSTHYTIWELSEENAQYVAGSQGSDPVMFVQGAGDKVFPGWEEGVLGMQVGGKRQLIIPPELGLGETGGGNISNNAALIMEIELVNTLEQPVLSRVPESELTTTVNGLAYSDLVTGTGDPVSAGQIVTVNYSGWLEDGTMFDSSIPRGEPFSFTLGQGSVIPGWEEGLLGMQVGGKRQLIIPAELAYGEAGSGGVIPANATLIFDIELLEIQEP
jgi:peptidylprolyl isomerase